MKKIFLILLLIPLLSCGVKKELAIAQQKKIELEKRLIELEKNQQELKAKNQEISKQNEEYRLKIKDLQRKKYSASTTPNFEKVFDVVEERAIFPGGDEMLMDFLKTNVQYPQIAKENGVQGTVYVKFIIEKDGSISNIQVVRGIGSRCDEEAIRVIKMMPKWEPGKQRGKPVRSRFILPFKFKLT